MIKCKASLLALCSVMVFSQVTYASSKDLEKRKQEKIKEKEQVSQEVKSKKENVTKTQGKVSSVKSEIDILDGQITGVESEISEIEGEIAVLNERIAVNQRELEESEANLKEKKELFGQRVKAMYMDGRVSYVEVLLNSEDMEALIKNNQTISTIAESDKKLVDYITTQVNKIKEAKKQLEEDKRSVEINKSKLVSEKNNLVVINNKKSAYMQSLESDVELYKKEYEKAENYWNNIDAEISKLQSQIKIAKTQEAQAELERLQRERAKAQAAKEKAQAQAQAAKSSSVKNSSSQSSASTNTRARVSSNASMMWPLPGYNRISSQYGSRYHPILKTNKFHAGVDIPAPAGTPVRAAKAGTVIMSRTMSGLGNVVMIDHGDVVTVYGHNSVLKARVGQQVNQGDVISLVGSTGMSTGNHLHFEVRVNGATRNPLSYV